MRLFKTEQSIFAFKIVQRVFCAVMTVLTGVVPIPLVLLNNFLFIYFGQKLNVGAILVNLWLLVGN